MKANCRIGDSILNLRKDKEIIIELFYYMKDAWYLAVFILNFGQDMPFI